MEGAVAVGERAAVARLDDLVPGRCTIVEVGAVPLLLVRTADRVHALQGLCTHARSVLGPGRLAHGLIECPMHGALFAPEDGSVHKGPARQPLRTFVVTVQDGTVLVDVPAGGGADPGQDETGHGEVSE